MIARNHYRPRLGVPLIIHVENITTEALNGDPILVDGIRYRICPTRASRRIHGQNGHVAQAQERYSAIRKGRGFTLQPPCKADDECRLDGGFAQPEIQAPKAGLFRTELQFLVRNQIPKRGELAIFTARHECCDFASHLALDIGGQSLSFYEKCL